MTFACLHLKNIRIFDDESDDIHDIHIKNNMIIGIDKDGTCASEDNCIILDGKGKFLMPGLMDAHVHLILDGSANTVKYVSETGFDNMKRIAYDNMKKTLSAGFTGVRDMGCTDFLIPDLRDELKDKNDNEALDIFAAGQMLVRASGHVKKIGRELGSGHIDIAQSIRSQITGGSDFIKLIASGGLLTGDTWPEKTELPPSTLAMANDAASNSKVQMAVHAYSDVDVQNSLLSGVVSIEHGSFASNQTLKLMGEKGIFLVPTLKASHSIIENSDILPDHMVKNAERAIAGSEASIPLAKKNGVKVVLGTDSGTPFNYHGNNIKELKYINEYKINNDDLISSMTSYPAALMGSSHNVGKIDVGYRADLLILSVNPMDDALKIDGNILKVIKNGIPLVN